MNAPEEDEGRIQDRSNVQTTITTAIPSKGGRSKCCTNERKRQLDIALVAVVNEIIVLYDAEQKKPRLGTRVPKGTLQLIINKVNMR